MPIEKTYIELEDGYLFDKKKDGRGLWSFYLFIWQVTVIQGKARAYETRRRSLHIIEQPTKAKALAEIVKYAQREDVVLLSKKQAKRNLDVFKRKAA